MPLKLKIKKADFDTLTADVQSQYKQSGDDYVLDLEGYEDPAELRRAKDREKQNAADAKKKADELQRQIDELNANRANESAEDARKRKDIETLEKSWQTKLDTEVAKVKGALTKREAALQKRLIDDTAEQLARDLAGDSSVLILPHIKSRLTADLEADEPTTRVLDAAGKVSALTVAELKQEFANNDAFSAIIVGSKGSGGGAPGGRQAGSGGNSKKFADMNDSERIALQKSDPKRFEKESAAAQKSSTVF